MKRNLFLLTVLFLALTSSIRVFSIPAYPFPVTITQPDGTTLSVILKGDEFHHYHTTEDGFLIVKDKKGIFNYAKIDEQGKPIDTRVKANNGDVRSSSERQFTKSLSSRIDFSSVNAAARQKRAGVSASAPASASASTPSQPSKFPYKGSPRSLVILVNFSDLSFVTPEPHVAFSNMLNQEGYSENGAIGSARDYFIDNSMGVFSPQFDVVGPYTLPESLKYYGENDFDGSDKNAVQMIVDACKAASADGIDFSFYDTDQDKVLDNVFVYYAGHNEAEHGGSNTVWPHRWEVTLSSNYSWGNYDGTASSITFNGVRLRNYACTSELRSNQGTEMAGIGTFTHEFGHVLGLADLYATDGGKHFTLSSWNIMDVGAYLNKGKTPPAYNAFERFQLGYLEPIVLKDPAEIELNNIIESNTAYLITESTNFRLSPTNTSEYFLLENRQRVKWDSYLPGKGLMIYRINYNNQDWSYNIPNNNAEKMGVEIMPADGIGSSGTLAGDPYPGSKNISIFVPKTRDTKKYLEDQPVLGIAENNGIVSFKYKGGNLLPPTSTEATAVTYHSFEANWEPLAGVNGYYVDVFSIDKNGTKTPFITNMWSDTNKTTIYNVVSDKEYIYSVSGSYKSTDPPFEITTNESIEQNLRTLAHPFEKELRAVVQTDASVKVFVPAEEVGTGDVLVFTAMGQLLKRVSADADIVDLRSLPKNIVLIIQSGKQRSKVIIN